MALPSFPLSLPPPTTFLLLTQPTTIRATMFLRRSLTRSHPSPPPSPTSSTMTTASGLTTKVRETLSSFLFTYWVPAPASSRINIRNISPPTLKKDYVKVDIYGQPIVGSPSTSTTNENPTHNEAGRPLSSHASSETVASSGAASTEMEEDQAEVLERFMQELGIAPEDEDEFKARNAILLNPLTPASRIAIVEAEMSRAVEAERVAMVTADPTLGASPVLNASTRSESANVWAHDPSHPKKLAQMTVTERESVRAREKVFRGLLLREE